KKPIPSLIFSRKFEGQSAVLLFTNLLRRVKYETTTFVSTINLIFSGRPNQALFRPFSVQILRTRPSEASTSPPTLIFPARTVEGTVGGQGDQELGLSLPGRILKPQHPGTSTLNASQVARSIAADHPEWSADAAGTRAQINPRARRHPPRSGLGDDRRTARPQSRTRRPR